MLATDVLVAHHEELRGWMTQVLQSPTAAERHRVIDTLMSELAMHEQLEDEIFYPAMRDISALVTIAHAEHRQLDDQLTVVLRMDPASDRFMEEFRALRAAVEHHAGKEESDMFPEVERKVERADLERIGDELSTRLAHLRGSRVTQTRLRLKRELVRRLP